MRVNAQAIGRASAWVFAYAILIGVMATLGGVIGFGIYHGALFAFHDEHAAYCWASFSLGVMFVNVILDWLPRKKP